MRRLARGASFSRGQAWPVTTSSNPPGGGSSSPRGAFSPALPTCGLLESLRAKCVRPRTILTALLVVALAAPACRPRDKVRLEPTEENLSLMSEVHTADPAGAQQLIRGFHPVEQNSWRWTQGKFAVLLKPPPTAAKNGAHVYLNVTVPEPVAQKLGSVTLTALLNGTTLGSATWTQAGEYTFTSEVPASSIGTEPVTFDFVLDRFLAAGAVDSRELGVIVSRVGLRSR